MPAAPAGRPLHDAVAAGDLVAEDAMEYGKLQQRFAQQTFVAHFVEVGVDTATGEIRLRRMLAVCAAGRINSCLSLAVMHEGDYVTTIEGLGTTDKLHPMQAAFIKHDGYQCGYCTPGQICSSFAVLDEIKRGIPSHVTGDLNAKPILSVTELRERMSGNICRCGAYSNIIGAITEVGGQA